MASMSERYAFFREHAGYIVGRSAECAMALARAEEWAEEHTITFRWEVDEEGEATQEGAEVLCCLAVDAEGHVVDCMGGVELESPAFARGYSRHPYARVVEAELAQEALYQADVRNQERADSLAARATYAAQV